MQKTFLHIVFKTIHEKNYLLHNSDIKRFHQINVFIVIQDWNLSIYCNLVILQMYYNFTNIHSEFAIVLLVCFRWFCTIFPCLLWSIALMTLTLTITRLVFNETNMDYYNYIYNLFGIRLLEEVWLPQVRFNFNKIQLHQMTFTESFLKWNIEQPLKKISDSWEIGISLQYWVYFLCFKTDNNDERK